MIRSYQNSDRGRLIELLRQNTPEYFAPEEEADLEDYLTKHGDQQVVYVANGQILGCGGFEWRAEQTLGWLSWFIVDRRQQGRGIGKALLNHCMTELQQAEQLEKIVVRTSQLVDGFFARAGFVLIKTKKDYWAKGYDLYVMEYSLSQDSRMRADDPATPHQGVGMPKYMIFFLSLLSMSAAHADQAYILALRQGDFSCLDELYRTQALTVKRWVTRNNGSVDDAQDVFQEAILAIHQKANDPTFVLTCPIGALLFKICQNKWLNQLRKKSKETEVRLVEAERYKDESTLVPAVEAIEEEEIRQSKLDRSFQQLSELCQQLLRLLADGISSAEAATRLEMNDTNTVYRRKNACVGRWRTLYNTIK